MSSAHEHKYADLLSALHARVCRLERAGVVKEVRKAELTNQPMTKLMTKMADMCEDAFSFQHCSHEYLPGQPDTLYMSVTGEDGRRLGIVLEYRIKEGIFFIYRDGKSYKLSINVTDAIDRDVDSMRNKLRQNIGKLIKRYNEKDDAEEYDVIDGVWQDGFD